jgi:hypothetical protein
MTSLRAGLVAALLSAALVAGACSSSDDDADTTEAATSVAETQEPDTTTADPPTIPRSLVGFFAAAGDEWARLSLFREQSPVFDDFGIPTTGGVIFVEAPLGDHRVTIAEGDIDEDVLRDALTTAGATIGTVDEVEIVRLGAGNDSPIVVYGNLIVIGDDIVALTFDAGGTDEGLAELLSTVVTSSGDAIDDPVASALLMPLMPYDGGELDVRRGGVDPVDAFLRNNPRGGEDRLNEAMEDARLALAPPGVMGFALEVSDSTTTVVTLFATEDEASVAAPAYERIWRDGVSFKGRRPFAEIAELVEASVVGTTAVVTLDRPVSAGEIQISPMAWVV